MGVPVEPGLDEVLALFARVGARRVFAKPLAPNDNSKNQIYLGPDFQALNLLPHGAITAGDTGPKPIFKAAMSLAWLQDDGSLAEAPSTQLILYPQYPEVRLSGFLKGCQRAPSHLMASRDPGRLLLLGVHEEGRVVAAVYPENSRTAEEFSSHTRGPNIGIFHELDLPGRLEEDRARDRLLEELTRIHRIGWIDSKQLNARGELSPCNAPQCGGFTLEAELGIPKNSSSEPDFMGWEVKQHAVARFDSPNVGRITLMTPEPTIGYYRDEGVEAFIRRYGYPDRHGRPDRLNVGGIHRCGIRHEATGLTLRVVGYDYERKRIVDASGGLVLTDDEGNVAAGWPFTGLLTHWSRKHSRAAYVPSITRNAPRRQYRYGHKIRLAWGTDPLLLVGAIAIGVVHYDPGIKLESASSKHPTTKRRSQFRIETKSLSALYTSTEVVEL